MAIQTNNDWDQLEEIIVGTADYAMLPTMGKSVNALTYADMAYEDIKHLEGPHDKKIIDEANEDLEKLSECLMSLGVKVHRPKSIDHSVEFSSPNWKSTGWYTFCPRDLLLPLDNIVIDTPSPYRARQYETRAYYDYLYEQMKEGVEWISGPRPILDDSLWQLDDLSIPTTLDKEIVFEAPNVVRLGKDLLYQVSNTGTKLGYQWLKTILEPRGYRIHLAENFYFYSHFDSTIIPLRPGLVLFNADRLRPDHYPKIFKSWDKIWISGDQLHVPPANLPGEVSPCSPYIGLNLLSVNPNLVIIDENQTYVMKELAKHGIESIGLPMRQARTLSGGFHCATLDVKRKGKLEDYFR